MQLTARLVQVLPQETGTGRNGEWKKQSIILETDGQYPKKVCVTIWGDKINPALWQPNQMLTVDFDIESREFNSRWYTDVRAWKVEPATAQPAAAAPPARFGPPDLPPAYSMPDLPPPPSDADADLPF
jgi:hypothetical protein